MLEETKKDVLEFFLSRFSNQPVSQGAPTTWWSPCWPRASRISCKRSKKIEAVEATKGDPDFEPLAVAFKRVSNILKDFKEGCVDPGALRNQAEQALYSAYIEIRKKAEALIEMGNYTEALLDAGREKARGLLLRGRHGHGQGREGAGPTASRSSKPWRSSSTRWRISRNCHGKSRVKVQGQGYRQKEKDRGMISSHPFSLRLFCPLTRPLYPGPCFSASWTSCIVSRTKEFTFSVPIRKRSRLSPLRGRCPEGRLAAGLCRLHRVRHALPDRELCSGPSARTRRLPGVVTRGPRRRARRRSRAAPGSASSGRLHWRGSPGRCPARQGRGSAHQDLRHGPPSSRTMRGRHRSQTP